LFDSHPTGSNFLAGVIEGFYGPPWTLAERLELLEWMAARQLNTYLYAPKDDLKHRAAWRELYTPDEAELLATLIRACYRLDIRFVYALSPGLDIRYSEPAELERVINRLQQMTGLGCRDFSLLFDDIPDRMHPDDQQQSGSFAAAQCRFTNSVFRWVRERWPEARFLFCPTPYCERMALRLVGGGADYLETVGRELAPEIDVFWTGPEIVSREITAGHVKDVERRLRRRPLIWDNLFANDYDGQRFYCGPYAGRPVELRHHVSGILCNPNTEFPLNFVPVRAFASYLQSEGDYDARAAYLAALRDWLPRFMTVSGPASFDDLLRLGDCYYLPHEDGAEAEKLIGLARQIVRRAPEEWNGADSAFCQQALALRDFCSRLADLRDRTLFYALHRRIWELREEMDLLLGYVRATRGNPNAILHSDFHLAGTYRGGVVAKLQGLLKFRSDGGLESALSPDRSISPNDPGQET
jgi:protein O-GlcNAcase/histone acetyltransferase